MISVQTLFVVGAVLLTYVPAGALVIKEPADRDVEK